MEGATKALIDNGATKILYSFYYIERLQRQGFIRRIQEANPHVQFFLDSGAFTYWTMFEAAPQKLMPWREYKRRYFDYIAETWPRWSRIAELDLDETFPEITLDRVDEWREEMFEEWPEAPITPVWHPNRGMETWTHYCRDERIRYLAIASSHKNVGQTRRMIWEAHSRNKLVHGFGMTRVKSILSLLNYDSVDSSSWLKAQRFGVLFVFQNNTFKVLRPDVGRGKGERRAFRTYFKNIGIDWRLIEKDDVGECRKANVIAWRRVSDRLEEIRKQQGRSLYDEGQETQTVLNETIPWQSPLERVDNGIRKESPKERIGEVSGNSRERGP